MRRVKAIGLTLLFGLLAVIISVFGALLGAILAMLTIPAMIFTGLWGIWFLTKEYPEED